jgi:hypothetical protein
VAGDGDGEGLEIDDDADRCCCISAVIGNGSDGSWMFGNGVPVLID